MSAELKQFIPLEDVIRTRRIPQNEIFEIFSSPEEELTGKEVGEELIAMGLMSGAGIVQGDIAVSRNPETGEQQGLCDHNCDEEGGYRCPARRYANRGLTKNGLAPADPIIQGFLTGAEGLREFNNRFVSLESFVQYSTEFNIPPEIQEGIAYNLQHGQIMANIFGGNAEMHPDALRIAQECHESGLQTTLTTTSGILLSDSFRGKTFSQGLQDGFVDILAVTAEFQSAEHIKRLASMSKEQLRAELQKTDFRLGQARKGIEAVNAAHMQEEQGEKFPQVLLNLVVHPGILDNIEEILEALKQEFPSALINPYPAQSSFSGESPVFSEENIPALTEFIDMRLIEQRNKDPHMTLRPHYYAMLKAVTQTHSNSPQIAAKMLSGFNTWKCFETPYGINGAGRVVQFGASSQPLDFVKAPHAGGYLDCFWNSTPTRKDKQVWNMSADEVADHIDGGMQIISKAVEDPCAGCIMPRLTGDLPEQELGINPTIKQAYLEIRKNTVGF